VPLLLVPLAIIGLLHGRPRTGSGRFLAATAALFAAEAVLLLDNQADYNDFKAIYAPLHTPDAKIIASVNSRVATTPCSTISPNASTPTSPTTPGMLGVEGPPRSFGLYRDGNRIAALPRQRPIKSTMRRQPWTPCRTQLIPHAGVMLAGASGGFRIDEALAAGSVAKVNVLERSRNCANHPRHGLVPFRQSPRLPNVADQSDNCEGPWLMPTGGFTT